MSGDAPLPDEPEDFELDLDDAPAEAGPLARGANVIKAFWKHAPMGPGVYRMIGESGEVLYVGKARSIKKRILSYTAPQRQSNRIARMGRRPCRWCSSPSRPSPRRCCWRPTSSSS
jgi:hypothetical protein